VFTYTIRITSDQSTDACEQGKQPIQVLKKPLPQKTARIQSAGHYSFLYCLDALTATKYELREGPKATYKTTHDLVTIFHTILPFCVEKHFYDPHSPFQKGGGGEINK
jgi:hypothetical protein